MVFQSYAIWPHLSVFDNVAFPRSRADVAFRQEVQKTMRALRLVQLDSLADRPAPFLSGGQQQEVALARALVAEPTVLLLDEPLSNLDAKLRAEMRFELKHLVKSLGVTTLYVTHDQMEALTMSDHVAVMQGVFVEAATPKELYLRPRSAFTATFLGGQSHCREGCGTCGQRWSVAGGNSARPCGLSSGLWTDRPGQRLGSVPA